MIKDYIKTPDGVFIHDDIKGMYVVDYQDNIDELLKIKYDIEVMQRLLNFKFILRNNAQRKIKFKRFLQIALGIFEVLNIMNGFTFFRRFLVSVLIMIVGEIGLEISVIKNRKIVAKERAEIACLKKGIDLETSEFEELKKDKTAVSDPEIEMVSFNYYEKKELLEKKLDLLVLYKFIKEKNKENNRVSLVDDKGVEEFVRSLIDKA